MEKKDFNKKSGNISNKQENGTKNKTKYPNNKNKRNRKIMKIF